MLVSNTLLVTADSSNSKDTILFLEPTSVQLTVRDNPQEKEPENNSHKTSDEEDDLPGFNRWAVLSRTHGNTICNQTTDNLSDTVKTEPNIDATTLLSLCIPLQWCVSCGSRRMVVDYLPERLARRIQVLRPPRIHPGRVEWRLHLHSYWHLRSSSRQDPTSRYKKQNIFRVEGAVAIDW